MDDFEKLKQLWQHQAVPVPGPDLAQLKQTNAAHQRKLERSPLISAICILLTSLFILWMGFFSSITFKSQLTYIALVLLALIPAIQAFINLTVYSRLRRIDVTAPIADHLLQWEQYYAFRQKMTRINIPIYYVLMNGAFGLYFIEMLGYFSLTGRVIALTIYVAWMLFAYFVLGKRSIRKENTRLMSIINNLKAIQQQLQDIN